MHCYNKKERSIDLSFLLWNYLRQNRAQIQKSVIANYEALVLISNTPARFSQACFHFETRRRDSFGALSK